MVENRLEDELERLIDRHGINTILEILSIICFGKAEHILVNWQDKRLAKQWERVGIAIDKVRSKTEGL